MLVSALPAVLDRVPDARLVVAGDPFDPIEPVREAAARLGVDGAIDWRLGYVRDERIPALMAEAAVVVLPSAARLPRACWPPRSATGARHVSDVGSLG